MWIRPDWAGPNDGWDSPVSVRMQDSRQKHQLEINWKREGQTYQQGFFVSQTLTGAKI